MDSKSKDIINLVSNWIDYISFIKRIPSVSLGLIVDGKLIFNDSFGYKNLEKKEEPSKNTSYRIASISKLFTTVSILQLVEQGKIVLDDPVSKYLDSFKDADFDRMKEVTIRHLLFHCGGLNRDGDSNHWIDDDFPEEKQITDFVKNNQPTYSVLENWKYSNLGFAVLGQIIEKVTSKSYRQYTQENILNKLDMINTEVDLSEEAKQSLATGYSRDIPGKERVPFNHVNTKDFASATGFLSTVEDLSKFLTALFTDNEILSVPSKKEMRRIQWEKDSTIKWGLGFQITKLTDTTIYGHSGAFQGYMTSVGYSPDMKVGVIVLTNSIDGQAVLLMNFIFNMITHVLNNYDSYASESSIDLTKYVGRYGSRWGDSDVRIVNNQLIMYDSLYLDPFYGVNVLEHVEGDIFKIKRGDGFGSVGENVQFFFKDGKVEKVISGYFEMKPVDIER